MWRTRHVAWLVALSLLLAQGASLAVAQEVAEEPTLMPDFEQPSPASPGVPAVRRGGPLVRFRTQRDVIQMARASEAARQSVALDDVQVVNVTPTEWSDMRLGCQSPDPRLRFAEVMISGYVVELDVAGTRSVYHTDLGLRAVLCDGAPVQDTTE